MVFVRRIFMFKPTWNVECSVCNLFFIINMELSCVSRRKIITPIVFKKGRGGNTPRLNVIQWRVNDIAIASFKLKTNIPVILAKRWIGSEDALSKYLFNQQNVSYENSVKIMPFEKKAYLFTGSLRCCVVYTFFSVRFHEKSYLYFKRTFTFQGRKTKGVSILYYFVTSISLYKFLYKNWNKN